ncbi:hypothetical protein [Halalkalibacter urbisdiaboli]|nr:hypothetical protein [Halalkalibacter urbisdiaboli]
MNGLGGYLRSVSGNYNNALDGISHIGTGYCYDTFYEEGRSRLTN